MNRAPITLVAAGAVAVAVVILVLAVGVERPPQVAPIDDAPAVTPPVALATHAWSGPGTCVTIVAVDGATREPWCSDDVTDLVGWSERGLLLETSGPADRLLLTVDPIDGEVVATREVDGQEVSDPELDLRDGQAVVSSRASGGSHLEVRLEGDGTLLWRTEAPTSYRVAGGWRSPDGAFVALIDSADRLLLVPADGSREPRQWATDVRGGHQVVWEGETVTSRG